MVVVAVDTMDERLYYNQSSLGYHTSTVLTAASLNVQSDVNDTTSHNSKGGLDYHPGMATICISPLLLSFTVRGGLTVVPLKSVWGVCQGSKEKNNFPIQGH